MKTKLFISMLSAAALTMASAARAADAVSAVRRTPLVTAVERIMPCVVNVSTERIIRVADPFDAFFSDFFGRHAYYYKKSIPLGSGIIVDEAGLILTNCHVVQRASEIHVRLWDGSMYLAQAVAWDSVNDLALMKLCDPPAGLQLRAAQFSLPDDVMLGETVIAVGNPFGLEHSVAAGVLSARNRRIEEGDMVFDDILQTDAAINPGNSGGPLINLDGDLIGVNVAIRRDAEGIGFAIPLKRIEEVLAKWLVPSRFSLGYCGLTPHTLLREGRPCLEVSAVDPDSPAGQAGLAPGDIIEALQGRPVTRAIDAGRILWSLRPADRLTIRVTGKPPLEVVLGTLPPERLIERRLGIQVQPLTPPLRQAMGLPADLSGLAISDVESGSDLGRAGARRGDIVFRVGDRDTKSVADLAAAIESRAVGDPVPVFLVTTQTVGGRAFLQRVGVNVALR